MNNIKILRIKKNMTQGELASQVHVTQTSVSQWESGKTNPDTQTSKKLAEFFNVTIDYLLGQSEDDGGIYYANNIKGNNFVQGNGSVTIDGRAEISKEETEILRIYNELDVRSRTKLLNYAFELEDENNLKTHDTQNTIYIAKNAARNGGEPTTEEMTQEELDVLMNAKPQTY